MTPGDVLQASQESLIVMMKVGLPLMLVALVVGVVISLLQALTQIQEMTLSFIPKIVGMFLALFVLMPFFGQVFEKFTTFIFDKIVSTG